MVEAIVASKIYKTYHTGKVSVEAVRGVDLVIETGQFVVIIGPSGSGKTTLLSILGCILTPSSGTLKILGEEIIWKEEKLFKIRREKIGFIFQHFNLLSGLTVEENAKITLKLQRVSALEADKLVTRALEDVGLAHRKNFLPRDLSGGEKQRASIARIIATHRPVILADEPTGNLDSLTGRKIVEILRDCSKKLNKTVVVVTHDQRIVDLADKVYRMEDGKLYET